MNREFVEHYLKRIGLVYNDSVIVDEHLLKKLQYAHVTTVPYETIDITKGICLSLDTDKLFDKIVRRGKGGFCFELNGLFASLLRELGYEITEHFARFLRGETEIPIRRHRVISVKLDDKRFLCDVGVGSTSPRFPLLIEENTVQEQFGEAYRFVKDDFLGWVIQERNSDGLWTNYFSFTEEPQLNKDFIPTMYYCEKHPDSPFTSLMLSIKTAEGRITIDDRVFKINEYGVVVRREELDDEQLVKYSKEYFGL